MSSGLMPGGFLIVGQLVAPSGTRTIFHQAAPPLGWTQDTSASFNDCDVRVNNASPSTGGSANWSGWNGGSTFNCNAITLAVAHLPVHSHGVNDGGHFHSCPGGQSFTDAVAGNIRASGQGNVALGFPTVNSTSTDSSGLSSNNTGSGGSFTPTYTTPVLKFSDHILGVKA